MAYITSLAGNSESRVPRSLDPGMASERSSNLFFIGISASLFATGAAATIAWCVSMSAMQGMSMPGGWTMSMIWMRMPGQTLLGAAANFLGMWVG